MNRPGGKINTPQSQNGNNPGEKRRIRELFKMRVYLVKYKWLILFAMLLTIASNLFSLVGPKLSGAAIDAIEPGSGAVDFRRVIFYCVLMAIFYAASALLSYILSITMIHLTQKVVGQLREDIFRKLTRLPVSYFDRNQTGDLISRISYDVDTLSSVLSTDIIQIGTSVITVFGSLIMMLTISPVLVLVFAVTIPISIVFTRYMMLKVKPLYRRRSAKLGELNGYAEEMLSGQKSVRAYGREAVMTARFSEKNTEAAQADYIADYYGRITGPSVNFINNLSMSLVGVFGSLMLLLGKLSLGNLSTFILYSRRFSGPINEFTNILSELQSAAAAADRVFRLLDEPEEKADDPEAKMPDTVRGDVTVEDICFGYDPEVQIIKNFSLHAKSGSVIAIVGPTGAGKTTIINLLMRFYDPDSGIIAVDGREICKIPRGDLRRMYTMVLQDTWLFGGTIAENIAYGAKDAEGVDVHDPVLAERIRKAARAAKIDAYIEGLPDGYDTILGDDGTNISKGQKQLITIARAMMSASPMLILDEATSNVDSRTEIQIQNAMNELMRDKTCFIIAHRLSTIQNADTILVMANGSVVETGNHNELMNQKGVYWKLYHAQFES